jgi:hypothetical protein
MRLVYYRDREPALTVPFLLPAFTKDLLYEGCDT